MAINTVINTNMMALTAHRNLGAVGNRQNKANQRLSSGKKINSAADDAAGLAISEKMKAQIRGLDMASKNSEDAISLIQTAEGSLTEVNNMLTRIRELTVQAANDTNQQSDRVKIAEEVAQLLTEVDSIADRTEFNEKKLNDGSFKDGHFQIGANGGQSLELSIGNMNVKGIGLDAAMDVFGVEGGGEGAYLTGSGRLANGNSIDTAQEVAKKYEAEVTIAKNNTNGPDADNELEFNLSYKDKNGEVKNLTLNYTANGNAQAAATELQKQIDKAGIEDLNITVTEDNGGLKFKFEAKEEGSTKAGVLGISMVNKTNTAKVPGATNVKVTQEGADAHEELKLKTIDEGGTFTVGGKTYKYTTNVKDKETEFSSEEELRALLKKDGITMHKGKDGDHVVFKQVNKGYRVDATSVSNRGQDYTKALDAVDEALKVVTTQRAKLGANQNRLEYTIKNLELSSENLNAARSRIEDTDMAKEMMNLTQANVLQQAATSILAQANQAPNNITQLLG